jgi:hypothetical protein
MEHAQGTDAEWRMLALMANEANAAGIVVGISMADLARRMGKSDRGVAGVKGRLKASGQLVILDEGGGRGRSAVYWINLPGLAGPEETPQITVESPQPQTGNGTDTPQPGSPKADSLPPTPPIPSTTSSSSAAEPATTKAGRERDFLAGIVGHVNADIEAEAGIIEDGLELLRTGKKVDSKLVTPTEMAIAAAAVAAFNRCFEWQGRKGSDYGLGANLKSIVMRVRDRPSWDASKHVRLVESAWRVRWWENNGSSDRRPGLNVIYGGNAFENVVQDARDEAGGESPAKIKKRRYTRG